MGGQIELLRKGWKGERKFYSSISPPIPDIKWFPLQIQGQIEKELAEMPEEDQLMFRESLGIEASGKNKLIDKWIIIAQAPDNKFFDKLFDYSY